MTTQSSEDTTSNDGDSGKVMKDLVKRIIALFELPAKPDKLPVSGLSMGEKTQKR